MKIRIVFTKYKPSLISRAIMWFSKKREHPERDCSHVMVKFAPGGIFEEDWVAFEAMERGVWMDFYKDAVGRTEVVGEFTINTPEGFAYDAMRWALIEYLGAQYDYAGIALFAERILASRWFASIVKWFHIKFRPKTVHALFCSGLALTVIQKIQWMDLKVDWGVSDFKPRTVSPRDLIDVCFSKPTLYYFEGGSAGLTEPQ